MIQPTNDKINDAFGGVKVGNIEKIDPKFGCALCELILLYPHQLFCCGTRLCEWCSKNGLSDR